MAIPATQVCDVGASERNMMRRIMLILLVSIVAGFGAAVDGQSSAFQRAIDRAKVVQLTVDNKKRVSSYIDKKDPSDSFQVDGEPVVSNYDVYRFTAPAGPFKVEVTALMMAGFKKKAIAPLVFAIGRDGSSVPFSSQAFTPSYSGDITGVWEFAAPQEGEYHLIVASDTRLVGQRISKASVLGGVVGAVVPFPVTAAGDGKYSVRVCSTSSTKTGC